LLALLLALKSFKKPRQFCVNGNSGDRDFVHPYRDLHFRFVSEDAAHPWHSPMKISVVFIPPVFAPLVAPRNLAPAVDTFFRPLSLSC
jgi:hypothetical protein